MAFEAPSCLTPVNFISNLTQGRAGVGEVGGGGKSMATTKLLQPSHPRDRTRADSEPKRRQKCFLKESY